jgi:hypothetical protein
MIFLPERGPMPAAGRLRERSAEFATRSVYEGADGRLHRRYPDR